MSKIIELWKPECQDCEAAKPVVEELEKEGYEFEKHNIFDSDGRKIWEEFAEEIDGFSRENGWEKGYIYTPTFINPRNRNVLAFANRAPTKKELIHLAKNEKG